MKNIILKIAKLRVLDGYVGILGVILFYKVLADYGGWIEAFSLSMRAWKIPLFSVNWGYHPINKNSGMSFYPPMTASVKIGKWTLFDTAREPARLTSERVDKWMAERKAAEAENERLIAAAKEAGL